MDIQRKEFEKWYFNENYKDTTACKLKVFEVLSGLVGVESPYNGTYLNYNVQTSWKVWQQAQKVAVPDVLENDCMISQTWFMKGSPVSALIQHAENMYKAEAIAQNSKIKFGTDDNEHWFAHDVPFFGRVQIDCIKEHGLVEWDIFFNECWQGPFNTKSECIRHLEECIKEMREEAQEQVG